MRKDNNVPTYALLSTVIVMDSILRDELPMPGIKVIANNKMSEATRSTKPAPGRLEFSRRLTAVPDGVDTVIFAVAFEKAENLRNTAWAGTECMTKTKEVVERLIVTSKIDKHLRQDIS